MKDNIIMIVIGGVLAWAGASLLKINALEVMTDENRQTIQSLVDLHLRK